MQYRVKNGGGTVVTQIQSSIQDFLVWRGDDFTCPVCILYNPACNPACIICRLVKAKNRKKQKKQWNPLQSKVHSKVQ